MKAKSKAFWKNRRPTRHLLALALLLPLFCSAQQNKLIVHPADPITVKRGASVTAPLNVSILPGFHVNGDKPKDEFLIPLKLTWGSGPLEAENVSYPKAHDLKVGNQVLNVLTGSFPIETKFTAPSNAPPGSAVLNGKLRYQACNDEMCFRPLTVDVKIPVVIQ